MSASTCNSRTYPASIGPLSTYTLVVHCLHPHHVTLSLSHPESLLLLQVTSLLWTQRTVVSRCLVAMETSFT